MVTATNSAATASSRRPLEPPVEIVAPVVPPPSRGRLDPSAHQPSARDLDNAHLTQLQDDHFLPNGRPWPTNMCGPTAALDAVRLLGGDIPGGGGGRSRQALEAARLIATGSTEDRATYPHEIAQVVSAAGFTPVATTSTDSILARARKGIPTVILGNANAPRTWDSSFVPPAESNDIWGHFVTIAGWDKERGRYLINDPGTAGTRRATAAEVRAFKSDWFSEPDFSVVPGEAVRSKPRVPAHVPIEHSDQLLREAIEQVHASESEHKAPPGEAPANPAVWQAVAQAHVATPRRPVPYADRAWAKVHENDPVGPTAPDAASAVMQTAQRLLGSAVDTTPAGTLDATLRAVRAGATAIIQGRATRAGAWEAALVGKHQDPPRSALVHGYLPDIHQYVVSDPRYRRPIHVTARQLRAFDAGAAGENVLVRAADA